MADDISVSSWARQASRARNQKRAIGKMMVAMTTTSIGLETPGPADDSVAQAKMAPTTSHMPDAAAATTNGRLDGFCCSEKIRPPMDGAASLAASFGRAGPAGRRLAGRRLPRSAPLLPLPGFREPRLPMGNGAEGAAALSAGASREGMAGSVRSPAPAPRGPAGGL